MTEPMNYFDLILRLPLPTPEQTARFADHVANNHSWFKQLPFFPPGASFVFFLNPHAGCGVKGNQGGFQVYDIEPGNHFSHPSRLATADYRDQFGHWDYAVDGNPRVNEPQDGPWLYGFEGGERIRLPQDLSEQWRCRFTAFLNPSPPMFSLRPAELQRERQAFVAYAQRCPADPDFARFLPLVDHLEQARESAWKSDGLLSFMAGEAAVQKDRLLRTLNMVRDACAGV